MKSSHFSPLIPPRQAHGWFPSWVLVAVGVVLVCATSIALLRNADREEEQMRSRMKDRADVLIWALEGGVRSMRGWQNLDPSYLVNLVEEVAKQPDIAHVAVIDKTGSIIAHSNPEKIGPQLLAPEELNALGNIDRSDWRLTTVDGRRIMEVFKSFTPATVHNHGSMGGMGGGNAPRGRWGRQMPLNNIHKAQAQDYFIFVGIDTAPFEKTLDEYVWSTIAITGLILLAGFTGILLLLLWQNYKVSRQLLKDTQVLASQVLESLPLGVFATDSGGTISMYNKHGAALLGFPPVQEGHRSITTIGQLDWLTMMREVDKGTTLLEQEREILVGGTKNVPVDVSVSQLINSDGVSSGYLFVLRDMGEIKKLQKQLRLNERLTALGNLAAGVAHEIRNPLSSIKGYAIYLAGKFPEGGSDYEVGQIMIQEVERLNRVVSDLLTVARPTELRPQPISIVQLLSRALRLIASDAQEKGVALLPIEFSPQSLEDTHPLVVTVDSERFTQALLNLLLNAIQATEINGSIRIIINSTPNADNDLADIVTISIVDNGCGMAEDTVSNIFTPYFTTKASGTGLGLTITHQIIERHGGEIKVYSQRGKGTAVTIQLPLTSPGRSAS